jgi:tetratricopeptide (TPR) repeat protein
MGLRPDTPADIVLLIDQFRFATDPNQRRQAIHQLQMKGYWQAIFSLIRAEDDPQQRKLLGSVVAADASKLIRPLVERRDLAEAEQFLELLAASDAGLAQFTAFLLLTGGLDRQIESTRDRLAGQPRADDWLRLAALLRAKGDLSAAIDAAAKTPDLILQTNLLAEAHRWADAAQVAEQIHQRSPPRLEIAAFAATFYRLAGKADDHERMVAAILKSANVEKLNESPPAERPADPFGRVPAAFSLARSNFGTAAEVLLVNERIAEALPILRKYNPRLAHAIYWRQHRHVEALEFVGVRADNPLDRAWFDALPAPPGDTMTQQNARLLLAIQVARQLRELGRKDRAEQMITGALKGIAASGTFRAQRLTQLAVLNWQLGRYDEAAADGAEAIAAGASAASVCTSISRQEGALAAWWYEQWLTADPLADRAAALQRALWLVAPQPPQSRMPYNWRHLVEAAEAAAAKLEASQKAQRLVNIARTCELRGDRELAGRLVRDAADASPAAALKAADLAMADHDWAAAAQLYEKASRGNPDDPLAAYLCGYARTKRGESEPGEEQLRRASLMALAPEVRWRLASGLKERGLNEEALQELDLVRRTAMSDSQIATGAAEMTGNLVRSSQPRAAADAFEQVLLHVLNTNVEYWEAYLTVGQTVHKLRAKAAIAAGKADEAAAELLRCEAILPGEISVAVELVPALDRAGMTAQAETLFTRGLAAHQQVLEHFPDSATYLNNTAWLCARSQRKLDEALTMAAKAVELAPSEPSYHDTLAEVHFQLGDRAAAVAAAQRAAELSPASKLFASRLKHFQQDELKTLDATEAD